jgi:hypothetical protein
MSHSMDTTGLMGDEVKKYLAPAGAVIAALGIVGGVYGAQALSHPAPAKPVVQFVRPAAQTITVAPSPTTTTPAPVKTTAATPRVVPPVPVQSTQAVAPAPRTVQKAAVVSSDTSSSAPAPAPSSSPTPLAPNDPARNTPPPPIKGNYTGGPIDVSKTPAPPTSAP